MAARRRNETVKGHSQFRTDRMVENGNAWYFLTREGTVEGPFSCRADAEERLETYVRLALNDFLVPESGELELTLVD